MQQGIRSITLSIVFSELTGSGRSQQDGGAAVENILISMLRKRAELTSTEPNLIELKALDKPNVEIVEDKQEVK